ncbi:flagellar basal-body rod protein FlgF [Heliobacterium chlorum]|uniref:Flagellar basal-body rod protein FlgF n=1 Tax=Heliobacterium chlorum TaxID=2698 RepID=A0ABR7T141_HELCL|nr:flagellar basal-body rod protein FlgF [Heliobacterium chlorum]MBC9784504.1 flagellar basal-body rod protein FlgF [Heliobacterium chlorum]
MIRGLYTSASGMLVQQTNQDVIANNLANVNTPSYKKDMAVFRAFPEMLIRRMADFSPPEPGQTEKNPVIGRLGTGATPDGIMTDFSYSGVRVTDNPTDLALNGKGYFVVNTPDGERYTRNGQFSVRADGTVVSPDGYQLLGQKGPIVVPANAKIHVDANGRIFNGDQELDQLRIMGFDEPVAGQEPILEKQGDSLFRLSGQQQGNGTLREMTAGETEVKSGSLELANVNVVQEMVQMISAARAYEANQKAIQAQDGTLDKACGELGRA